jgi:hypothetical protein
LQDHTEYQSILEIRPISAQIRIVQNHPNDQEDDMVRNITAALVAASLLASTGIASAQSQRFDGVSYQNNNQAYCYLPSSPCDNEHRLTN